MPRSLSLCLLLLATACGGSDRGVLAIADGAPRIANAHSFLRVIQVGLDSSRARGVRLATWSVTLGGFERSEGAQAERYAQTREVVAVVGHAGSKGTLLALPAYKLAGIPVVVPSATSRQLKQSGALVFMMVPDDSVEGAFIADAAVDTLHATRVAVVYVADAYGTGIRDGVARQLEARGVPLTGDAATSGRECASTTPLPMRGIVRALLKRATPDVVVLGLGGPQATCAIREIKAVAPQVKIIAADSFDPHDALKKGIDPTMRVGVHFVSFWERNLNAQARALDERTQRLLHRPATSGDALEYDAYMAVAAAIAAGNRTRDDVARFLSELGTDAHPALDDATGPIAFNTPRRSLLRLRRLADEAPPQ